MILASISGGQSLGKPLPDLSRQGPSLCEGPFSVSCRKSKPFKPSDAVGFDEKSLVPWRNKNPSRQEVAGAGASLRAPKITLPDGVL